MTPRSLAEPIRSAAVATLAVAGALLAFAAARAATAPPAASADPVVARVDDRVIRRSEIDSRKRRGVDDYERETGREAPASFDLQFQRLALEEAVRERLVADEARARGLVVPAAQVDSVLAAEPHFRTNGRFDAAKFAAYKRDNPKSYEEVRRLTEDGIAARLRMRELEHELAPDAATLDRLVARRTERAKIQSLLLSEVQFDGVNDPSDAEVRAAFEKNPNAFAPPMRLGYRAIFAPAVGADGRVSDAARESARRTAERLLGEVRAGVPFDSIATRAGLVAVNGSWGEGQVGGLFALEPAWGDSAIASPVGRVLPAVIPTDEGFAIVRVDRKSDRATPRLDLVAVDLRARMRRERESARELADARAWYASHPEAFVVPTRTVRWATVDTARVRFDEPKDAELEAWFAARRNEFARLDPGGGGVRLQEYAEVKDEVRARVRLERRIQAGRALADRVAVAWARGESGPGSTPGLSTGGPALLVTGGSRPTGLRPELADSALAFPAGRSLVTADPRGYAVVAVPKVDTDTRAPFEAVEPQAIAQARAEREAELDRRARAHHAAHPERYRVEHGYAISYATVIPPSVSRVDVPGEAIERYYRENPSEFGTPAQVHVRHLLVGTQTRSPEQALSIARALRQRIVAGESLADLARAQSDDPASRPRGGDLGWVLPGTTVPEFERAAYALTRAEPLSPPVTSSFGVHLIELVERREGTRKPFADVRFDIASKLATQYADTIAAHEARRLLAEATSPADLLARAERAKYPTALGSWYEGLPLAGLATNDRVRADATRLARGERFPTIYKQITPGYVVAFLDSLLPPRDLTYEECGARVKADLAREASRAEVRRRGDAALAQLTAGKPWAEVAAPLGGSPDPYTIGYAEPLPGYGALPGLDSLLFGADAAPTGAARRLPVAQGDLLVQVKERTAAAPDVRARERENVRRIVLNRRLYDHVERLRSGARVDVLRAELSVRPPAPPSI